jgi:phosphohistidine phosphatase
MRKRLYLLRHAKSSWKQPELADHERPLAGRGKRAAKAMASYLAEHDIAPELVLCSTSVRTRATLERIGLDDPNVSFERELYGASAGELAERVRAVRDDVSTVMLIGHNPALEQLAGVGEKFPTGALAVLELDADSWSELSRAKLVDFVKPRDLTD